MTKLLKVIAHLKSSLHYHSQQPQLQTVLSGLQPSMELNLQPNDSETSDDFHDAEYSSSC